MKITVLVENKPVFEEALNPGARKVRGEHGLALLVEFEGCRLLFDTGAGDRIGHHARALKLDPVLERLDMIVLSHSHYDHTGGLAEVLRHARGEVSVHVGPAFFSSKVRRKNRSLKRIGAPFSRSGIESLGARIIEAPGTRQIFPGLFLVNPVRMEEEWEDMEPALCLETAGGEVRPDPFEEEQVLCACTNRGLVVFVGCAHRGLVNSITTAMEATQEPRVRCVFGGAHLRNASEERIRRTAAFLASLNPERIALGHCTGEEGERQFSRILGSPFSPLRAGAGWELE